MLNNPLHAARTQQFRGNYDLDNTGKHYTTQGGVVSGATYSPQGTTVAGGNGDFFTHTPAVADPKAQAIADNQAWANQLYQEALGRDADPEGIKWLNELMKTPGMTNEQILAELRRTPEGKGYQVNATLMQDPAYAAYLAQVGVDQAGIENKRIADIERIRQLGEVQYAKYDRNEAEDTRIEGNRYAGRGMYKAGGRHRAQGRIATDYGIQRNEYGLNMAQQMGDIEAQAAQDTGRISRERDLEERDARQRLFDRDAKGYYDDGQ